jgi:small subunit ribosomal protein S27e
MRKITEPSSKFVKVRCSKCKNEQIIFGKSSVITQCLVCSTILSEPTGGKSRINARILEVLE